MRPHGLEADREQVVGRQDTVPDPLPLRVAERLEGLDAAAGQVLDDALHQHPGEPASGELREHLARHQQGSVRAHR